MSGPKTADYEVDDDAVARRARAQEAEASRAQREAEMRRLEDERNLLLQAEMHRAKLNGLKWSANNMLALQRDLAAELQGWQAKFPGQTSLSFRVEPPPAGDDIESLERYLAEIGKRLQSARVRLEETVPLMHAQQAARAMPSSIVQEGALRQARDVIRPHQGRLLQQPSAAAPRNAVAELRTAGLDEIRQFLAQGKVVLSADLENMASRLLSAGSEQEAAPLVLAIRSALQALRSDLAEERAEAARLLESLPAAKEIAMEDLRMQLASVRDGGMRINQAMREGVRQALASWERKKRETAAGILKETLTELGYEVEPIEETLFVEGGTVHFRRPEWDESYFVRLRASDSKMNFNVVRLASIGRDGADKAQDTALEEKWCDDLNRVKQGFGNHGLHLRFTRQLDAGAVPVQQVSSDSINMSFWEEQEQQSHHSAAPVSQYQTMERKL